MAMTEKEVVVLLEENQRLREKIKILAALNEQAFMTNIELSKKLREYEEASKVRRIFKL